MPCGPDRRVCWRAPGSARFIGNVSIPGFATASAFGWLAEDGDSADSEPTTKTVALTPHTVSGSVPITRRLIKQSSPAVELLVRNDLVMGAATALDIAALQGDGLSNVPTGILNITDVSAQAVSTAGGPTWAEIVGFESSIDADNALVGSLSYVMHPLVVAACKTASIDSGSGRSSLKMEGRTATRLFQAATQEPMGSFLATGRPY